jgi:predicted permease
VLLIACVNVANLLLARGAARRQEVGMRCALVASHSRVVRLLMVESLPLSVSGGLLGFLLATWLTSIASAVTQTWPRGVHLHLDGAALLFSVLLALVSGMAAAIGPALAASKLELNDVIQEAHRTIAGSPRRLCFRKLLLAVEIALSLPLLIGAGLLLKSFLRLRSIDPGFASNRVLTLSVSLPASVYNQPSNIASFYERLTANVTILPGVRAAGLVTGLPVTGHVNDNTFRIEGRPLSPGQFLDALFRHADPGYFEAMGIPLEKGRYFQPVERLQRANKVIISESFARKFFPNENALGKRLLIGDAV